MPKAYLEKVAKSQGIPLSDVGHKWDSAKKIARDAGHEEDWAYITGIFKRMAHLSSTQHILITSSLRLENTRCRQ